MSILFTPDDLLITGWADGFIRAHSASDGLPVWQIADAHRGPINCLEATAETLFRHAPLPVPGSVLFHPLLSLFVVVVVVELMGH